MVRKTSKRKNKSKNKHKLKTKPTLTNQQINHAELSSENIIRLKLTTRKGTRIESVPLKKLEKLSQNNRLCWELNKEWLILYGI